MKCKLIFLLFLIVQIRTTCLAQDTIRVTDYGYVPGSRANAVPYVFKALN